ncbi:MAG: hypothetical protein DMF82_20100 [Acidobacteria bacterium]|nr:MAG: hypothetical protein DMF82_20100 [Acidobacteriota bacterium]
MQESLNASRWRFRSSLPSCCFLLVKWQWCVHKEGTMGAMKESMLREMALRGLAPRTQQAYVGWMVRLVSKTRVPADQLSESQVRTYLGSLSQRGLSASTLNQAINAVRFFFNGVLHRDWALEIHYQRAPQRVPVTLTPDEVGRLLAAVPGLRERVAMRSRTRPGCA